MTEKKRKNFWRKAWAFVLALCLSLSLCPQLIGTAFAVGEAAMDQLLNWGVVGGYPDGGLHPERSLTRAEFVAMVNRAYGYTQTGATPFTDVPNTAWFYDDIGIAYNANYFGGVSPHMAAPDSPLTREQAMVLLARNMRLDPVAGEVTEFADGRSFADWSRGYARAAAQMGLIGGYGDGSYKPQNNISRGEMGIMLQRALGTLVNKPGTHTLSDTYGNVTISSTGTTLKDTTIAGNLYITGGLDLGDITLDNVRVLGDIIVAGGGESQSGESIILRNVKADSLLVDSIADQYVSLRTEGNTEISDTLLRSDAFVQDRTRPGQGLLNVSLESPDTPANFTLSGNLENVVNKTPGSLLNIAVGTVDTLTIDEKARNSTLNLDVNSTAATLNLDTATNVTGIGDVDKLYVNSAGSVVEMLPDAITIRPGLTAVIAGETMNATQAQESSTDPRLLAGYPKLRNIAPTTATGVYSANKSGTVYWAVSATVDGSVAEEELILPTEGNTQVVQKGNLPITASETETAAAIASLIPDGNYYLSAVMTDARGRKSPVKVVSFVTPDNTVPAFNTGYPVVSQNEWQYARDKDKNIILNGDGSPKRDFHVQVSAMPNKSCVLYYALYEKGSAALTAQQFRIGALGAPIQSGTQDATKNYINYIDFTGLEELKTYDAYFCLIDADGARSSVVRKLTFTTVDGTPPSFMHETPTPDGNPLATSIPTRVNMSENSTVYWVAVRHSADKNSYIGAALPEDKDFADISDLLSWLHKTALSRDADAETRTRELDLLKRKIEAGTGSVSNGSSSARANADLALNITRLAAETAYDIFYVAKDAAGNYSDVAVIEDQRTLDVTPPTVKQVFTQTDITGNPYATTNIELVFSEDVQLFSQSGKNGLSDAESKTNLLSYVGVTSNGDLDNLSALLSQMIFLYNDSGDNPTSPETSGTTDDGKWVVDFRNATISSNPDTGEVTVTLSSSGDRPALNLKSGATYHFVFNNIQDCASTPNRMERMPVSLVPFRTIAAQVTLRQDVSAATLGKIVTATDNSGEPTATADSAVEIDMAFSMRPVSVNVEESVLWDMLLWSDTTVEYDLYTRVRDEETAWTQVKPAEGSANSAVTILAGSGEFIGRSLYAHFKQTVQESIKQSLNTDKIYEYAIHFTKVGDSKESDSASARDGWNQDITFHVNVLTSGTAQAFNNLTGTPSSSGITAAAYTRGLNEGIASINTTDPNSEYFSLFKSFTNSLAPNFIEGRPTFSPQDSLVDIQLMADRPCTAYYVIAPFSDPDNPNARTTSPAILTTARKSGRTILYEKGTPDSSGFSYWNAYYKDSDTETHLIPTEGQSVLGTHEPGEEFEVSNPSLTAVALNPNFGNDRVKSGNIQLTGNGYQILTVTGLDPSTSYFAYFVLQSAGQANYSEYPMLYQFQTTNAFRPNLTVRAQTSIVSITHQDSKKYLPANVDYALFDMTILRQTPLWDTFYSTTIMDSASYAAFESYLNTLDSTKKAAVQTYKVYQAIQEITSDGESLFDKYASTDYKRSIANLAGGAPNNLRFSVDSVTIAESATSTINTATGEKPIITGNNYYMLIAGRYSNTPTDASGDSIAFRGASPLFTSDETPPKLDIVDGNITVDYNTNTVTGNITLQFNKELYYYDGNSLTERYPIHLYERQNSDSDRTPNKPYDNTQASTGDIYRSVAALKDSGAGFEFVMNSTYKFQHTRNIQLTFSKDSGGETLNPSITLRRDISGEFSNRISRSISLTLDLLDVDTGLLPTSNIHFVGPDDIWLSGQQFQIYVTVKRPTVAATGVDLPSELELSANSGSAANSKQLIATVLPTQATNRNVIWRVAAGSEEYITLSSRSSVSGAPILVTGLKSTASGYAVIQAYAEGAPASISQCRVRVVGEPTISIKEDGTAITILRLPKNSSSTLTAEVTGISGSYSISWKANSSDIWVSKLDELGTTAEVSSLNVVPARPTSVTVTVSQNNKDLASTTFSVSIIE